MDTDRFSSISIASLRKINLGISPVNKYVVTEIQGAISPICDLEMDASIEERILSNPGDNDNQNGVSDEQIFDVENDHVFDGELTQQTEQGHRLSCELENDYSIANQRSYDRFSDLKRLPLEIEQENGDLVGPDDGHFSDNEVDDDQISDAEDDQKFDENLTLEIEQGNEGPGERDDGHFYDDDEKDGADSGVEGSDVSDNGDKPLPILSVPIPQVSIFFCSETNIFFSP